MGAHQGEEDRHYVFNTWLSDRLKSSSASFVQLKLPSEEERNAFRYPLLEQELFPLMDQLCGSDVEVVLYVPPLSKLYFAEQGVAAEPVIYMLRKILSHIESCENFRLHAFDVMPFTSDMNHYRDFMHYVSPVSDALLEVMARREYVLTLDNIAAYEEQLVGQLNTHRITTTYPAPLTELILH